MPLNSVNTNVGAMVALQSLNQTNTELGVVQGRINTGKKINSAKDNGAVWAIAQGQRAESQGINSVKESLQRGVSTVDVAISAGEAVSDLLLQMKEKALSASDTGLSADSRKALEADYISLAKQITTVVDNASFNGVNMLKGDTITGSGTSVRSLANAKANSSIDVAGVNFQLNAANATAVTTDVAGTLLTDERIAVGDATRDNSGHTGIKLSLGNKVFTGSAGVAAIAAAGADVAGTTDWNELTQGARAAESGDQIDAKKAKDLVGQIDDAIKYVSEKLTGLGTGSKALSSHLSFMSKLQDSLDSGVGDLVDADLAKESARLQALQTKQQLGVQALSIANQSTGTILGLFR